MTPYIDGVWKDGMAYTSNDPSFNQQVGSYQADCILASFVAGCDIPPAYLNEINATAGGLLNPLCFQQIKFQAGWSAVQDPNEREQQIVKAEERGGDPEGDALGALDGEGFGGEFAENDVEKGDDGKGDRESNITISISGLYVLYSIIIRR